MRCSFKSEGLKTILWAYYISLPLVSHKNTPLLWLAPMSSSSLILMSQNKLQHYDSGQKIGIICKNINFLALRARPPPYPGSRNTTNSKQSYITQKGRRPLERMNTNRDSFKTRPLLPRSPSRFLTEPSESELVQLVRTGWSRV